MALENMFGDLSLDATSAEIRDNVATATARLEAIRDRLPAALVGGKLSVDTGLNLGPLATEATLADVLTAIGGIGGGGSFGDASAANQALEIAGLTSIDGHVDGLEAAMATLNGKDFATQTTLAAILAATATAAKQDAAKAVLDAINGNTDGIEALLSTIDGHVDGLETLHTAGNATLTSIDGHVDGLEGLLADRATDTKLETIRALLAGTLTIDSELPAAAALGDGDANPTAPSIASRLSVFNGTTWDRQRGVAQGTLLSSAARTGTTTTSQQTNFNSRGVLLFLNVTAASGTGGIAARIRGYDPVGGVTTQNFLIPTAVTATGFYIYAIYPGSSATSILTKVESVQLPRLWDVSVIHSDSSSYTYSLGYCLIP